MPWPKSLAEHAPGFRRTEGVTHQQVIQIPNTQVCGNRHQVVAESRDGTAQVLLCTRGPCHRHTGTCYHSVRLRVATKLRVSVVPAPHVGRVARGVRRAAVCACTRQQVPRVDGADQGEQLGTHVRGQRNPRTCWNVCGSSSVGDIHSILCCHCSQTACRYGRILRTQPR